MRSGFVGYAGRGAGTLTQGLMVPNYRWTVYRHLLLSLRCGNIPCPFTILTIFLPPFLSVFLSTRLMAQPSACEDTGQKSHEDSKP